METPGGPKGTRDFYPELMNSQTRLFDSWRRTCRRYAFEEYEAPMFEHLDIYTQKSGDEIEKQLYTFEDKGGRMMALRPEMTPSLARMVAAKGNALKRPIRWYSIARLFRYEKMQKGRLREFFQLNMDILGSEGVAAEAELMAAVIDMLCDLGLSSGDVQVRISSRTLLEECFAALGLPLQRNAQLYALLDRKAKISNEDYENSLAAIVPEESIRKGINALFCAATLDDVAKIAGDAPSIVSLRELFALLGRYGFSDFVRFDIGIVRGLAYYTGTVFEVFDIDRGMRAIAGGGRYDKLVGLYGGPPTPAIGFAAGDVVLSDLLHAKGLLAPCKGRCDVFIAAIDEGGYADAVPFAQELRCGGLSCEFPLKRVNVGKQMKQADAAGAQITCFLGGEEALSGEIRIKRMSDGAERVASRDSALQIIREMVRTR